MQAQPFSAYVKGFFVKCLENMASAKMWMFLLPFAVSTAIMGLFMWQSLSMVRLTLETAGISPEQMSGIIGQLKIVGDIFIAWCTFNVSLASVIIAVREIFKVKKLNALAEPKDEKATVEINMIKT